MSSAMSLLGGIEPSRRAVRAHAMKNCVSVIVAISEQLERELAGEARERWERLRADALRLRALLIEDLRDDARLAASVAPTVTPCSVTALVEEVVDRLSGRAESAGVELFIQCGGGSMVADASALAEALFNLMTNAIDATPAGGGVFLATHEMLSGDQCWIVQDTGHGMPAEQLADFGRPYASTREGGAGLGVAVARSVIARHGGLLRVESQSGSGTTVTAWLPRGDGAERQ